MSAELRVGDTVVRDPICGYCGMEDCDAIGRGQHHRGWLNSGTVIKVYATAVEVDWEGPWDDGDMPEPSRFVERPYAVQVVP